MMAQRSSVSKLPQDVRQWLEQTLVANEFGGYGELVELLRAKGFDISRTALHRWGRGIARQRTAIREEALIAQALLEGIGADARETRSEAVMALIQTGLLRALRELMDASEDDSPAERVALFAKIGKDFATMLRGSMELRRFQAAIEDDARRRLLDEEQRAKLAELGKSGGVPVEVLAQVVRVAYGIDVPINDGAPAAKGVSDETRQAIRETLGIA